MPCDGKSWKYGVKNNNLFTNLTTFNTKIIPGFENVLMKAAPSLMEGKALEEPSIFTACTEDSPEDLHLDLLASGALHLLGGKAALNNGYADPVVSIIAV